MLLESKKNRARQGNGELAALTSGRPASQQHEEHAEGSDTSHVSHTQKALSAGCTNRNFGRSEKDHAARRGRDAFGTATRISASLFRRFSVSFWSASDQDPKAAKFAVLTSGRPAFQQHVKRTEGSDTTPSFACAESPARRVKKQQHHQIANRAARPSGAAAPRNSDAHERIAVPKALCVLREHPRPSPKSGKVRRSDTRPGDVRERAERSEGNDSAPIRIAPCFAVCALVCDPLSRAECVPIFTRESKRGPFVPEVLKSV